MSITKHIIDSIKGKHPINRKRSSKWPEVRATHLKDNPNCAVCGSNKKIEVHHIHSFVEHPELELSLDNLITLCESRKSMNCHLVFGHLDNFRQINPNVVADSKEWKQKLINAKKELKRREKGL